MYKYVIESNKLIAKNILSLRLRAQNKKDVFDYLPGQYAAIGFKNNGRLSPMRCFSFTSSPSESGILEFGIRVDGFFTQSLAYLRAGDEIFVMGPFGDLTLDPRRVRSAVFLAGGIGITPFVSMIRTAMAQNWPTKITLLYSCRQIEDAAFAKELLNYHQNDPDFNILFFVSDEDLNKYKSDIIFNGRIGPDQIGKIVDRTHDQCFYLCGPSPFMTAMRGNLLNKNVSLKKIISEEFSSTGNKSFEKQPVQKIVNRYVLAGVFASLILITYVDASNTVSKLNSAQNQNITAQESPSLPTNSSSASSSIDTTSGSSVSSSTNNSSQPTTNIPNNSSTSSSSNLNNSNTPSTSSNQMGGRMPTTGMS